MRPAAAAGEQKEEGEKHEAEATGVVSFDPFVVNLADGQGSRFLRVAVQLVIPGKEDVIAARAQMRGYRPARFFLLAWSALLLFVALGALRNFALVPTNFLTLNGLHVGLALDVLLLSMALEIGRAHV